MMNSAAERTILIVDDSEELLDVLSIVLEKQNHEVIVKNNPDSINEFVKEKKIDLLLLDIMLGEKDGRDICRELKSDPLTNYFPVIIMSVTYDLLSDYKEFCADDFLEKPFELHELLEKIDSCLKKTPSEN